MALTSAKQASFGLLKPEEAKYDTYIGKNVAVLQHIIWYCKGAETDEAAAACVAAALSRLFPGLQEPRRSTSSAAGTGE
ncbi:hypothetical protein IscW_ISCW015474 [Ixodes scapularis]|uniref:Uncharacterized protein n=1 Tax=Ixodes scapularis TaxID=6945 RepID=B7QN99_IXOSC|nr:hypothetical protein IscW_ISCW015474 [Ixodes scapularis]|eukprot:XP_002400815.1 hypothetical protein IscW_ISCW015474 [Ixodes scapularis]